MKFRKKSKLVAVIAIMLVSVWLYSNPPSQVRFDINNVYYNQGEIKIMVLDQGHFGQSYTQYFQPTVYCCGVQTLYWDNFPIPRSTAYVEVSQGGRTVSESGVTFTTWPYTSFLYLALPPIPNFPHKNEQ
jgi:hypothetical protein